MNVCVYIASTCIYGDAIKVSAETEIRLSSGLKNWPKWAEAMCLSEGKSLCNKSLINTSRQERKRNRSA